MFMVPVEGTQRIDLALELILNYFLLLMIMLGSLPASGNNVPLLGMYLIVSSAIVVLDLMMALVLHKLYRMKVTNKPIPKFLMDWFNDSKSGKSKGKKLLQSLKGKAKMNKRKHSVVFGINSLSNDVWGMEYGMKYGMEYGEINDLPNGISEQNKAQTPSKTEKKNKKKSHEQMVDIVIKKLNKTFFFASVAFHIVLLVTICFQFSKLFYRM